MTGEGFRMAGFWAQPLLLGLIDAATIAGFVRDGAPAYHYVGFAIVNVVLLALTFVVWRWLRDLRREATLTQRAEPGAPATGGEP